MSHLLKFKTPNTPNAMKKFYLIRHAQSESNAGLAVKPNHLIALTALGERQAAALSDWLCRHVPTPNQVFVSSYVRTRQTAKPYLDKIGQTAVQIDALREFNYLDYEHIKTLNFTQIVAMADEFWVRADKSYTDSPATDSFADLVKRVKAVRDEFERLPTGEYVVFTHGMWLGMLMWQLVHGYQGGGCARVFDVCQFRKFELSVRPKNCEVFMLSMDKAHCGISKIKNRNDE